MLQLHLNMLLYVTILRIRVVIDNVASACFFVLPYSFAKPPNLLLPLPLPLRHAMLRHATGEDGADKWNEQTYERVVPPHEGNIVN